MAFLLLPPIFLPSYQAFIAARGNALLSVSLRGQSRFRIVWGFGLLGNLTQPMHALCDSCSSGQKFASGFLQIPPRDGHPCLWLCAWHYQPALGTFTH